MKNTMYRYKLNHPVIRLEIQFSNSIQKEILNKIYQICKSDVIELSGDMARDIRVAIVLNLEDEVFGSDENT